MKCRGGIALVAAFLGATLSGPAWPARSVVFNCDQESTIFVRAGGDIGSGTQSTQYNYSRPLCAQGNPMANTTFLKLETSYRAYVETGYYHAMDGSRDIRTAFAEYFLYPNTLERWWDVIYPTRAIPLYTCMMYAISKQADDVFSVLLAFQEGGAYEKWTESPHMGYSYGRPQSEISRYGPGDASGSYRNLQFKDPSDATWHPWRSLNCDYDRTTMSDWRVHRVSSTSWYSEHLPAAGSGCE